MNIAVVTFWESSDNYGQILQGLAMQRYLISLGHKAFIVRFHEESPSKSFKDKVSRLLPSHIIDYIRFKKVNRETSIFNSKHQRRFTDFKNEHLNYSDCEFFSYEELLCADWSKVDAFVCGSDQIWSPKYVNNYLAYLLAFAPLRCRKIAYACSFGRTTLDDVYIQMLRKQLATFDVVGLRENSGVSICHRAGRKDAKLVADPTLLLHAIDYADLISNVSISASAFIYLLNWKMPLPLEQIDTYLKTNGLSVAYFPTQGNENIWQSDNDLSIKNWITQLANSQIVFTNSFHGTVFSILFHRPFVSFALEGKDAGMNDRLLTLLTAIGLENRIYKNESSYSLSAIANQTIDWNDVDDRLDLLRNSGVDLLNQGLQVKALKTPVHRICFYTSGAVHHRYGGLDRVTELLADEFEKEGHEVYYLSYIKRDVYNHKRQYFLPEGNVLKNKQNIIFFNRFLKERGIDVLINQEAQVDITLPIDVSLREKIKVLSVVHFNPNYIDKKHFKNKFSISSSLYNKIFKTLFSVSFVNRLGLYYLTSRLSINYRHQLNWADNIVLLSDRFKRTFIDLTGSDINLSKITAINNPCMIPGCEENQLYHKENLILYVGRLDIPFKRIDHTLDIWKVISTEYVDWQLLLVGDGDDRERLELKVKEEGIQRVRFEGIQNPNNYYKRAKMILLTSSVTEGWGMVLVEAQSYGCVPMCYKSYPAISDIVTDGVTGGLVDNDDDSSLIDRVKYAIENPNSLQHMSEMCKKSVKRFDIGIIADQWQKLMNK